ncbi:MAG: hypothetical protein ACE5JR_13985 [Gemmatimonadota bacterium]
MDVTVRSELLGDLVRACREKEYELEQQELRAVIEGFEETHDRQQYAFTSVVSEACSNDREITGVSGTCRE